MIEFRQADTDTATQEITERLLALLPTHQRVVWVVTGGSSIPALVKVLADLPDALTEKLAIMLSDERYGPLGHPDSNMQQYAEAGLQAKRATIVPVLRADVAMEETAKIYNDAVKAAFTAADYIFATLGMGPDGHIAGILPDSEAVQATTLVTAYAAANFKRITMTFAALKQVDECALLVFGEAKRQALENLRDTELPLREQPAQIIKQIPRCIVWNDQIGGTK